MQLCYALYVMQCSYCNGLPKQNFRNLFTRHIHTYNNKISHYFLSIVKFCSLINFCKRIRIINIPHPDLAFIWYINALTQYVLIMNHSFWIRLKILKLRKSNFHVSTISNKYQCVSSQLRYWFPVISLFVVNE